MANEIVRIITILVTELVSSYKGDWRVIYDCQGGTNIRY